MVRAGPLHHRRRPPDLHPVAFQAAHVPDGAVRQHVVPEPAEQRGAEHRQLAGQGARGQQLLLRVGGQLILNGQLTTTNAFVWDIDDQVGDLQSTNVYRYSRNILLGVNAVWYLGRSGRYTDPFLASVEQRTNELEFTLTYEI